MENNRYNNTKIYKMYDMINGYFYIGSTCSELSKRIYQHKCKAKHTPDRKVYKYFTEVGWDNVKIVLMEEHFLDNREQQLREEDRAIQIYIDDEKCLNSLRPWISLEEKNNNVREREKMYRQNSENFKTWKHNYDKEFRESHKEYIKQLKDQKWICGCGIEVTYAHKTRHENSKKHQAWLNDQQQTAETI